MRFILSCVVALLATAFFSAEPAHGQSTGSRLDALEAQVAALQTSLAAETTARQNADAMLAAAIVQLENVLEHFSREGDDIFITGANLHVLNGTGDTESTNGLGNLIVGYN